MTTFEEQLTEINNLHIIINELSEEIKLIRTKLYQEEIPENEHDYETFVNTFIEFFMIILNNH